ncbi:MAG TPA: pyridoxamine 5'-phosphate oxidase family protein [Acidimicrobiales bacterium]|nr:pyridoxamine 5'-phosphate oxidase family protein [Acidimicrobiales bacterium]
MADPQIVFEALDEAECRQLLGSRHFGRLGVVNDEGPLILPVNYVFDQGRVAIRTDPGTKLDAASLSSVAFEVDEVDEGSHTGWSVLVRGIGHEVTEALDVVSEAVRRLPVEPWAPGQKAHWIRVDPRTITGRRLRPATT